MTPAGGCGLTESLAVCLVSGDGLSSCNEAMAGQGWPRRSPAHFPLPRKVPSTFDALCLGKARLQHPLHLWNPPTWSWVAAGPGQRKVGEQRQISPSLLPVVGIPESQSAGNKAAGRFLPLQKPLVLDPE